MAVPRRVDNSGFPRAAGQFRDSFPTRISVHDGTEIGIRRTPVGGCFRLTGMSFSTRFAAVGLVLLVTACGAEPVDRPFDFVITDTANGAPLFLGRVGDPTAGVDR